MKYSDRICWVTAVGDDPSTGGGVARAVNLIKNSGLIDSNSGDIISLQGITKFGQIALCAKLLARGYRKFVIHSFFSPFSLFLLCLPFPVRIVVLPHGELKAGAFSINFNQKHFFASVVKFFYRINLFLKRIGGIVSNDEEAAALKSLLPVKVLRKAPDFLSNEMFFAKDVCLDKHKGLNLIAVARMVPNKGISDLLKAILNDLVSPQNHWVHSLDNVHVFYVEEDSHELARVNELSKSICSTGLQVHLYSGLDPDEISLALTGVPNRFGFISSHFESFGYALVESLGFEYKPLVWFNNELVDQLNEAGLCLPLPIGSLGFDNGTPVIQLADTTEARMFINNMIQTALHLYQFVISRVLIEDN